MANVNVRIDENIKKSTEDVFKQIGITPSAAINLFYIQVIRTNSIPFNIIAHTPNDDIKESHKSLKTNAKTYKDIQSLKKALDV
jgi:addiction module RelB/DinJ family antitoxin